MTRDELVLTYIRAIQVAHAKGAVLDAGYERMAAYVEALFARFPELRHRKPVPFAEPVIDTPTQATLLPTGSNTGYVPKGSKRMEAGVSKATGTARKSLEYGIERHDAALGRG